jgi:hypothetical protein
LRLELQAEAAQTFATRKHRYALLPPEGNEMSTKDRASNRAQDAKGRVKKAAGRLIGNSDLKNKGETDVAMSDRVPRKNLPGMSGTVTAERLDPVID